MSTDSPVSLRTASTSSPRHISGGRGALRHAAVPRQTDASAMVVARTNTAAQLRQRSRYMAASSWMIGNANAPTGELTRWCTSPTADTGYRIGGLRLCRLVPEAEHPHRRYQG